MFEAAVNLVKASRPIQFLLVFIAGGIVAGILYPTKHVEEKVQKTYEQQIATLNQQHSQELATQQSSYQKLTSDYSSYKSETDAKISSLTTEVTNLKTHDHKTFYKIVHPDGTVEERASDTSDSQEQQQVSQQVQQEYQQKLEDDVTKLEQVQADKIASMQKEWDSKEQSYQQQISSFTSSKVVDTNKKDFTIDVGGLTSLDYYGHVTYNVFGPFVLGLQAQFGSSPAAGAGIGLRF